MIKIKEKMTQKEIIKKHLDECKNLDRLSAFTLYGIFESPARISELRKEGFDIKTTMKSITTKSGRKVSVASWSMNEKK